MKILLSIAFELLEKGQLTAAYLTQKYAVSARTVYRHVDKLSHILPLCVKRGRGGGIYLAEHCRLPVGFLTESEYRSIVDALENSYAQTGEERFLSAKRKLSSTPRKEYSPESENTDFTPPMYEPNEI